MASADVAFRMIRSLEGDVVLAVGERSVCCLQEQIASAEGIDRAMALGTGFPADEKRVGGFLRWANEKGLDWVLDGAESLLTII